MTDRILSNAREHALRAKTAGMIALAVLYGCSADSNAGARSNGSGGAPSSKPSATGGSAATNGGGAGTTAGSGLGAGAGGSRAGSSRSDGGADAPESCNPVGSTRSCCNTGTQTCGGNSEFGIWGPCQDSGGAVMTCTNTCKNDEFANCDGGMPSGMDSGSPGEPPDGGHEVPDSGHQVPDAGCGPGMECKPGAIRYCDDPAGEWTMSTCDASGTWGPCVVTTVPEGAVGLGDCSPTDYSPEMCCPQLHLCCQNDPFGAFEDWGSGACAAVSCP